MIVSEKYKFVFIKAQRIGGTSVHRYLVEHGACQFGDKYDIQGNHETYLQAKEELPDIDDYFLFGVVRNPFDRAWSYSKYISKFSVDTAENGPSEDWDRNLTNRVRQGDE